MNEGMDHHFFFLSFSYLEWEITGEIHKIRNSYCMIQNNNNKPKDKNSSLWLSIL